VRRACRINDLSKPVIQLRPEEMACDARPPASVGIGAFPSNAYKLRATQYAYYGRPVTPDITYAQIWVHGAPRVDNSFVRVTAKVPFSALVATGDFKAAKGLELTPLSPVASLTRQQSLLKAVHSCDVDSGSIAEEKLPRGARTFLPCVDAP
jgi:hypothetical protein